VLDALMFEERGIPGIALVTEPFRQTGAAMAGTWGLPGFRFLDVPHPIAILGDKDLDERADRLAPLVAELLGAPARSP
jgi:hypothetical protein